LTRAPRGQHGEEIGDRDLAVAVEVCRVPGVGKKTAQKILLHLQDRIKALEGVEGVEAISEVDSEVLAALTTLGYSVVEAQAALQTIPRETPQDVETRLRIALQYFSS